MFITDIFLFSWMGNISSQPGISTQVLDMLRDKQQQDPYNYSYCSLMIDGMSIRKHIDWDPKRKEMVGFVDLGTGSLENDVAEAREAIVILAVGLKGYWKVPIGYFLINAISAEVQSQLVLSAISALHDVNVRCTTLIMDGHPTNQKMAEILGCRTKPNDIRSSFAHPSDDTLKVFVLFDACHLLKNLRGALYAYQEVTEPSIGTAKWVDIVRLENLQNTEGLRAANKLTSKHIHFQKQKMNVKLAAQTLSNSVAKALQYAQLIKCKGFDDCQGTVQLISLIDKMFDVFNSRTPAAKGFKGPLSLGNLESVSSFLLEARAVLLNLRDMTGKKLCEGKRKICVLGFVFNIDSLLQLASELIVGPSAPMRYLLTYKFSQDHLELLFSAIRRYGGWNNNPSATQFANAYRSLLSHTGVAISSAVKTNCIAQDVTSILNVETAADCKSALSFVDALSEHDDVPSVSSLSKFVEGIIEYVAGFVVRKVVTKVNCAECAEALVTETNSSSHTGLLQLKNNGGLVVPSSDVIKVVSHCETVVRSSVDIKQVKSGQWEKMTVAKLLATVPEGLFTELNDHFLDTCKGIDTHYSNLLRLLCEEFLRIRRFHTVNLTNWKLEGISVRKALTKTVLFKNQ